MAKREKAITIKDVAKAANVSITTVSRVLNNNLYSVNDETRQRVKAIIEELNFVPNAMARGIRFDKTKTIGLIIQDINNPYYPGIVQGVENTALKLGFSLILANAHRSSARIKQYLELMREKRVDGLILAGGAIMREPDVLKLYNNGDAPIVVIGKPATDNPSIQIDNPAAGRMVCEYLLDRGHRNIAMISGPTNSITAADREAGYRAALADRGLSCHKGWVVRGNFVYEGGRAAVEKLPLEGVDRVTAIFAQNDLMAIGAINALNERGLRVPEDVSVIGFDDIQLSSYVPPGLTTVHVPFHEMGKKAMEALSRMLNSRKVDSVNYMPVHITVRGTVANIGR